MTHLVEEFDGTDLDTSVWLPHYLPAWSSRAETAATYEIRDSCLVLSIPPHQRLWMPAEHAMTKSSSPRVSVVMNRLRPLTFFPAS